MFCQRFHPSHGCFVASGPTANALRVIFDGYGFDGQGFSNRNVNCLAKSGRGGFWKFKCGGLAPHSFGATGSILVGASAIQDRLSNSCRICLFDNVAAAAFFGRQSSWADFRQLQCAAMANVANVSVIWIAQII
jgi:hypothetical protein